MKLADETLRDPEVHEPERRMRFAASGAEWAGQAELNNWVLPIDIQRAERISESSIGEFGHGE